MPLTVPPYARLHDPTITPDSFESIGDYIWKAILGVGGASTAWPLANLSMLFPFSTWHAVTIAEVFWVNGAGTGGNIDIGIYNSTGVTLLASLGSTGKSTASAIITSTTFADYALAPGDYYMAVAIDGTTNINAPAVTAGDLAATGVLEAASNFPLATGITPVLNTRALMPSFGLALDSAAL